MQTMKGNRYFNLSRRTELCGLHSIYNMIAMGNENGYKIIDENQSDNRKGQFHTDL